MTKDEPAYKLSEIQYLITERQCDTTRGAKETAHKIGFSETEIYDEIIALEHKDFHHSVEGKYDGKYQDVYKKTIRGVRVYIKFKTVGKYGDKLLVLSFKRDESVQQ